MTKRLLPALCFLLWLPALLAQNLQSPEQFLGYRLGEKFTYHHRMAAYFQHVARESELVSVQEYGQTFEGRPLMLAFITSAANQKRLEQIRANNLAATGLLKGQRPTEPLVPIVWLSYSIHGNEAAGVEAAIKTLYELAAQKAEGSKEWLDNMVIVIDPCENPDGRDRYTNWYYQTIGQHTDYNADSWPHQEPWPGGRFNHFVFDLNRDWLWQTQQESRLRLAAYKQWMPHVHVDFHEMGMNSPYFFGPAARPYHAGMTTWQREFHQVAGKATAAHFDRNNWLYFTGEVFDLFYPSYGDTWPIFNGAIGFTVEQGGSGRAGTGVIIATGDTLTLTDRLEHHVGVGMATLLASYQQRERLTKEFEKYFSETPNTDYRTFVLKGNENPDRLQALLALLDAQQISYGYAQAPAKTPVSGYDYFQRKPATFQVESSDILVSTAQPMGRLVHALLEPDSFLEDSVTYDLTAWALPYVFGVQAYALKERLPVKEGPVAFPFAENALPAALPYAYAIMWKDVADARFLAALQKAHIRVRVSEEAFTSGGKNYPAGTLLVTRTDNERMAGFDRQLVALANQHKRTLYPLATGMAEKGKDVGSGSVRYLNRPKIALVCGDGISPTSFGEVWHFIDTDLGYPVSVFQSNQLAGADLSKYNTLVLVAGRYNRDLTETIQSFAKGGGKVIALESSIAVFSGLSGTALASAITADEQKKAKEAPAAKPEESLKKYGSRERDALTEAMEGSIFRLHLDATHPLAFGYADQTYLLKRNDKTYPYLQEGWNVGFFKDDAYVSGFVGHKLKKKFGSTLSVGMERVGRGSAVYFTDSPIIRGFWHSGKLMMSNALFILPNKAVPTDEDR